MLKEAITKLFCKREKSVYTEIGEMLQVAEVYFDLGEAWPAADFAQLAMDEASLTGNKEFADSVRERALKCQFASYDPLTSEISFIKSRAYDRDKKGKAMEKICSLEKTAEEALKELGIEGAEKAKECYLEAIETAKDLNDSKLVEELKINFKEAADRYIKRLV